MANIRAFIAVLLTDELKREIRQIQERFIQVAPDVKWMAEDNFHVTMKFLGDVDTRRIDEIADAIESAVETEKPFALKVSGVGSFPNPRRPQVVWVGVESGVEQLAGIADKIESAMERIGFPRENRMFSAHITIGRVRQGSRGDALAGALQESNVGEIGEVDVKSVALMQSELRPKGPIYSVLREITLKE